MAETRTITIELIDKTEKTKTNDKEVDSESGLDSNKNNKIEDLSKKQLAQKTLFWNYAGRRAYNLLKQATISTANRYWSLTEDYLAQNSFNNAMTVVGETIGFGTTLAAGFKIGGVAGGAIAAVGYAGAKAISTAGEYSNIRQSINATNYNMQFQRTRMGLVDNGRGTEN